MEIEGTSSGLWRSSRARAGNAEQAAQTVMELLKERRRSR